MKGTADAADAISLPWTQARRWKPPASYDACVVLVDFATRLPFRSWSTTSRIDLVDGRNSHRIFTFPILMRIAPARSDNAREERGDRRYRNGKRELTQTTLHPQIPPSLRSAASPSSPAATGSPSQSRTQSPSRSTAPEHQTTTTRSIFP